MTQNALDTFKQLCDQRDRAAYRVVGAIDSAIHHCRKNETEAALRILSDARTRYELADAELENFKRQNLETISRKTRTAAA